MAEPPSHERDLHLPSGYYMLGTFQTKIIIKSSKHHRLI